MLRRRGVWLLLVLITPALLELLMVGPACLPRSVPPRLRLLRTPVPFLKKVAGALRLNGGRRARCGPLDAAASSNPRIRRR